LPIGIQNSMEIIQPEMMLLLFLPVLLLFPFAAMVITWFSKRPKVEKEELSSEEKQAERERKKDLARRRTEAAKARKERERARKKRSRTETEVDEWDKALEETYRK
jgi:biopolymer transport protein ExbB/TolQ